MTPKLKNIFRPYYKFLKLFFKLNILKTIYINFRKLPFKDAIKLPIFLYGKVKIASLKGKIIINAKIKTGLVQIGYNIDGVNSSFLPVLLHIDGEVIFEGYTIISKGVVLNIGGKISIGNCCTIGSGSFIKSMERITINDNTQITYNCSVFDSDMHYVKNIETGIIKKNKVPIIIGKNCWINAGTIISKGTILPDYSITARNSYLSKDYSEFGKNLFLVGAPAKPTKAKVQRIFSIDEQSRINKYFQDNKTSQILLEKGIFEDDRNAIESFFKLTL